MIPSRFAYYFLYAVLLISSLLSSSLVHSFSFVKDIESDSFFSTINTAPFCIHCRRFKPHYEKFAATVRKSQDEMKNLQLGRVDCVANYDFCGKMKIEFYPTVYIYKNGDFQVEYKGPVETQDVPTQLLDFVQKTFKNMTLGSSHLSSNSLSSQPPPPPPPPIPISHDKDSKEVFEALSENFKKSQLATSGKVQILNEDDFSKRTKSSGAWLIFFCQTGNQQCQNLNLRMLPELALFLKNKVNTAIFYTNPDSHLAYTYSVTRFPTVILLRKDFHKKHHGSLELDALESFAMTGILPSFSFVDKFDPTQIAQGSVQLVYNLHSVSWNHHSVFLEAFENFWILPWIQYTYTDASSLTPGLHLYRDQLPELPIAVDSVDWKVPGITQFVFQHGFPLLISLDETNIDILMSHSRHSSIIVVAAVLPGYFEKEKQVLEQVAQFGMKLSNETGMNIHIAHIDRVRFRNYVDTVLGLSSSEANLAICVPGTQARYLRLPYSGKYFPLDAKTIQEALKDIALQVQGKGGNYSPEGATISSNVFYYLGVGMIGLFFIFFVYRWYSSRNNGPYSKFD